MAVNLPQTKNLPTPNKPPAQEGIVPPAAKPQTPTPAKTPEKNPSAAADKSQTAPEKSPASKVSAQQAQEVSQKVQATIIDGFLWTMLIGLALAKDVLEIVLNLIPYVGGFLAFILTLPCTMIIYIILFQKGILSLWKNTGRLVANISCIIADNVPMINFLPVTTLNVIVLMSSTKAEQLKEKVKTKAKQTIAPQSKSSASTSQPTSSQNGSQDTNKSKQTSQAMA